MEQWRRGGGGLERTNEKPDSPSFSRTLSHASSHQGTVSHCPASPVWPTSGTYQPNNTASHFPSSAVTHSSTEFLHLSGNISHACPHSQPFQAAPGKQMEKKPERRFLCMREAFRPLLSRSTNAVSRGSLCVFLSL